MFRNIAKLLALAVLLAGAPAIAQIQPGQIPNGPSAPRSLGTNMGSNAGSNLVQPVGGPSTGITSTPAMPSSIASPASTVGNTPSSLQSRGPLNSNSSGYSASGSTVNTNINNTNVGNRSGGQPIGSGSQTSTSSGPQTSGSNIHH